MTQKITKKENTKMKKIIKYTSIVLTSAAIVALPIFSASAEESSTTITAQVGSTISINSTANVSFAINPTASNAKASSGQATVTVSTNNATGYNLKIAMNGAARGLANGGNTIDAHAGTLASPSTMATNSWGYRVTGAGGFGAGVATAESNVNDLAQTWAGVPAQNADDTIKTHASAVQNDNTNVMFGAKVDSTKPSGNYTGTVVFTAAAN